MPEYQVFRLKENLRHQFRSAPHLSGVAGVKPKDYEESATIDAESPYAAWHSVRGTPRELAVGDLLCIEGREMCILKYIGFEEARWVLPEVKPSTPPVAPDGVSSEHTPVG
jgi:hypothetical protein